MTVLHSVEVHDAASIWPWLIGSGNALSLELVTKATCALVVTMEAITEAVPQSQHDLAE